VTLEGEPLQPWWSSGGTKAAANLRKHRVGFQEAATVLEDPLSTTFPDEVHSTEESRFVTIGVSDQGRVLVVAHAERNDTIRFISARRATRRERAFYEQGKPKRR
jgi:uncharacterized DUF497 family protein